MHACIWKSRGAFAQPPQPTCTTACMTTQPAMCMSESSTLSNTPPRCASDLLQGLVWLLCLAFKVEKLSWTSWTEKDWGIQRINEKKGQWFRLTSDKKWKKTHNWYHKMGWGQQNSTFSLNLQSYLPFCLTPSVKGPCYLYKNLQYRPIARIDCPS